jgi:hypothetical protein
VYGLVNILSRAETVTNLVNAFFGLIVVVLAFFTMRKSVAAPIIAIVILALDVIASVAITVLIGGQSDFSTMARIIGIIIRLMILIGIVSSIPGILVLRHQAFEQKTA